MDMLRQPEEESVEQLRQRKLEEALEIKSLRRIISAYLNYPDAADEDVKRYERSYKKLSPAHKVLLPHYLRKFRKLRQCIAENSHFIFGMLQAFDPPLNLSQDADIVEHAPHDMPNNPLFSSNRDSLPFRTATISRDMCLSECTEAGRSVQGNAVQASLFLKNISECIRLRKAVVAMCPTMKIPLQSLDTMKRGADMMAVILLAQMATCPFQVTSHSDWLDPSLQLDVPLVDVDKVRFIIRNIVRDWAAEGKKERDQCYKPILDELDALFPNRTKESPPACLVPGAGLGRLALEISSLGFISQGNEFSYYMMICSSFILNQTQTVDEWTIYPWIHSNCNSVSDDDQLRPVSIPDILPASAGITEGFSMCGGDFVEVYRDPSQAGIWDVVVTCFFIDTAHNIIDYIEIISRILKDGGVWINLGPLLYRFADMYGQEDEMSIELSLEDVKRVAFHYGFHLEKEKTIETTYTPNPKSMMQNRYYAAFWTMRKKPSPEKKYSESL